MAEHLWLIRRSEVQGRSGNLNKVNSILINIDDGDDDLTKMDGAESALNTHLGRTQALPPSERLPVIYPQHFTPDGAEDGYFDEVIDITDLSGTGQDNLRTEGDYIAFGQAIFEDLSQAL